MPCQEILWNSGCQNTVLAHLLLLSRTKEPRRSNDGIVYIQWQQVLVYLQSHQRIPIRHRCSSKEDEPLDALLHGHVNEGLHRREHLWGGCRRDEVDPVDVRFCGQGIFECRWVVPVEFDASERLWDDAFARCEEYGLVNFFKKTGNAHGCLASSTGEKDCHDGNIE